METHDANLRKEVESLAGQIQQIDSSFNFHIED